MVIQYCLTLLNELSEIERNISKYEKILEQLDLKIDRDKVLKELIRKHLSESY
jgi:hypothetical protein